MKITFARFTQHDGARWLHWFASTMLAVLAFGAAPASAEQSPASGQGKPLWEVGFGAAPLTFPAYRGSDEQEVAVFPLPYVVYRGNFLRADRDGIRGRLFSSDRVRLVVRGNGSVPVDSDDVEARRGMEDLDFTFELGPLLSVRLASDGGSRSVNLRVPVAAVFSTDFSDFDHRGFLFSPQINVHDSNGPGGWSMGASAGPVFATEDYHDYFYEVEPRFETADRAAYDAGSGYSGTRLLFSARRRFDRLWVGAFVRYDYLGGAVFDDSPLVDTDHALSAGVGLAWVFKQSTRLVSDNGR